MRYTFHVKGMHCKSCELMIKSELEDLPSVSSARVTLATQKLEVEGDFGEKTSDQVSEELTAVLLRHGYSLHAEVQQQPVRWSDFTYAFPLAAAFIIAFIALQALGIVNFVDTSEVTYGTAFFIGVIASLSSCMAVVGGLVLSLSATFARSGDRTRPQILFHLGRLLSFFVLGGVIGAIGTVFQLTATSTFVIGMIVGLVMLILGINLLDVFHVTKRFQIALPEAVTQKAQSLTRLNHTLTPVLAGLATFFLPCGFTQSMQVYTLSTGSFLNGALTMFVFALGTLPVLALLSFSSFSIKNHARSGIFFKTAGLIVIAFALLTLTNSLVAIGIIEPVFSF